MKLRLVMADPAGNRTALILSPVPPERYASLSRAVMALPELGAEQAGFVCPPRKPGSTGRLEMMGGEFCGNAARSFGLLLAARQGEGRRRVPIEISGCEELLSVEADPERNTAASPMPLPRAFDRLSVPELSPEPLPVVLLPGITHIVARDITPGPEAFAAIRRAADARWDWEALGAMFFSREGFLAPAVAVRATGSVVFESSCASGSTALAAWLSREEKDGVFSYAFPQPGGTLTVRVERVGGAVTAIVTGGPVILEPPRDVTVREDKP